MRVDKPVHPSPSGMADQVAAGSWRGRRAAL
jgi:hypothetical protein